MLLAGDACELDTVQAVLDLLPSTAYGQVLVETDAEATLPRVPRPPRVTLTQVRRGPHDRDGARLSESLRAWVAEWAPEIPDPDREVTVWIGATVEARGLDAQFERL